MLEDISSRSNDRTGYVLGSVSTSIFEANHLMKFGHRDLKLWPFEAFDPRMVCQGECNTIEKEFLTSESHDAVDSLILNMGFEVKPNIIWGLKFSHLGH